MRAFYITLVFHLLAVSFGSETKKDDEKALIMLEIEPVKNEDRSKRSSVGEGVREERQSPEVPQEYLGLLQQLAAQQQQTSASAQQPQQHLIQQLVVSRDSAARQPQATRYILSQDGRFVEESAGLSAFAQTPQYPASLGYQPYQQSPLTNTQPQQLPTAPTTPRPATRPPVSEYTRQQQRLLQEYREAPLRAQIAGIATRPQPQRPVQPVPTGPNSQSAQIFAPAGQSTTRQQLLPGQFQDPNNPGIIYTPVPVDAQTYYQQQLAQQQIAQQQLAQQYTQQQQQLAAQYASASSPEVDPRQLYAQTSRPGAASSQVIYQQPEVTQDKVAYQPQQSFSARRPITVLPGSASPQPQLAQQSLPQQYLIETTKPTTPQPPQYISSADVSPQFQYVQQPPQIRQQQTSQQQQALQSTLLQPVAGRGLFTPHRTPPSRSSIYVSRSSAPKSVSLNTAEEVSSEKVPVVRLPSPPGQRPLSQQEFNALVNAGYSVTPVYDQPSQYLKTKRQPISDERRNHVVYENHQDGVQYQYSPGTSDATATIKTKKSAPNSEYFKQLDSSESEKRPVTYAVALGKENS